MSQPSSYSSTHEPLVAFAEDQPGVFAYEPDLVVEEVQVGSVDRLTNARGRLYTGEVRSAIAGAPAVRSALPRAEIDWRYPPHKRFAVGTFGRDYLAVGYLAKQTVKFGAASAENAFWNEAWTIQTQLEREAEVAGRVLQGQYYPTGEAETPARLVQALRLCFNPEGRPNRFRDPVELTYPGRYGEGDEDVSLYVFTDPDGPHAELWTYHQALQYLWWVAMQGSRVRAGNLFDTDGWVLIGNNVGLPGQVDLLQPGWPAAMLRYCETFCPEGMTILQALVVMNQLCGLRFREEVVNVGGEPVSRMRFWVPPDPAASPEMLEVELDGSPFASGSTLRDVEGDVLQRNNVAGAQILKDFRGVRNRVKVVGDRKYVVVRAELKPWWTPDALWDDVDEAQFDAVTEAAIGGDDFSVDVGSALFDATHPEGAVFAQGQNRIVGRVFGVDFGGELVGGGYERSAGPYQDYAAATLAGLGTWFGDPPSDAVSRRRRIRPLTATDAVGRSRGVVLEVSWDGGTTWNELSSDQFGTLPEHWGIEIRPPDLLGFGQKILERLEEDEGDKPVRNYYDAYVRRRFRIRATGLVELDDRVVGEARDPWSTLGTVGPLGPLSASHTVLKADEFKFVDSEAFADHDFHGQGDRDDEETARRYAAGVLEPHLAPQVQASPTMPWLDLSPQRYAVGTPIGGVRRSMLNADQDLSFTAWQGPTGRRPEVIGKIFRQSVEGASTELVLEAYTYAPTYA